MRFAASRVKAKTSGVTFSSFSTAPSTADRLPVYNNATKGHDRLFREIAAQHFQELLDERDIDWRKLRQEPEIERDDDIPLSFDELFPR